MNKSIPITDDIYWIGVNDTVTEIFEGIWPIPLGVTYSSYLIDDEKIALIDTVKEKFFDEFLNKIKGSIGERQIDYLIINHMEPDHSGAIKRLLNDFPNVKIIANKKTAEFLNDFYRVDQNVMIIKDNDVLDLGKHKLKFHLTPMLHWPETMMTYDMNDKILFSGDAFGGFGALKSSIFDDEVDLNALEDELLRYYSNIVGKYSPFVQKTLTKLKGLDVKIIAATHGPVWRKDPSYIIKRYDKWSRFEGEDGAMIAYASMYGNTEKMALEIKNALSSAGIKKIAFHNVSKSHVSYLIMDAWRYNTIFLGSPAYDAGLFPLMKNFITLLEQKGLGNRNVGIFGTYTWCGGATCALKEFAQRMKWKIIEPIIEAKSSPKIDDLKKCDGIGKIGASSHQFG